MVAAVRAAIWVTLPLLVTFLFALWLDIIAALTWENFGYILTDAREVMVDDVLIAVFTAELIALGILALLPAAYATIHYPAYAQHVFGRPLSTLFSDWTWRAVLH